jgi:polysaccharide export outer membrane protein
MLGSKRFLASILVLGLLSGCGGGPRLGGDPGLRVLDAASLPVPERMDVVGEGAAYYVGPLDRLTIDVFGIKELSEREVQVDGSGRISFPLAGAVDVLGKTPGEVEADLAQRLRLAGVRDPQVTVNLKDPVSRVVTVEGEVHKPGLYPVTGGMTLMGAVARAEGTTEYSRLDEVVVFRKVRGERYAALYNLDAIRHGAYADPPIYAGDIVMVGDSSGRRLFKDILQTIPLLTTPLIVALQNN